MVSPGPSQFAPALTLTLTTVLLHAPCQSIASSLTIPRACLGGPGGNIGSHGVVADPRDGVGFVPPSLITGMFQSSSNLCLQRSPHNAVFEAWKTSSGRSRMPRGGQLRHPEDLGTILNSRMSGGNQQDQTVLFVGNLPWAMDSYGLQKVFETCGDVVTAQISFDNRNDRSRGFGHVVFRNRRDAENAIRSMNNRNVGGRTIQVYISNKPRAARNAPSGGGRVDMRALRVNPSADGQRYAVSKEKLAYRYARDWVDSGFDDRMNDPELNLGEDEWHPVTIEDNDAEEDWSDYLIRWDKWDPEAEEVVFGYEKFEPLYKGTPVDWDMDFNADPRQVFGDGSEYMIADPARAVPENFDRIFIENDQRTLEELREQQKNGTIIDATKEYQVATRAKDQFSRLGRGRRDGTNIVDPFGKRNVRRGLRERANSQSKAILDRMKEQSELLERTLSDVARDPSGADGGYGSRTRRRDWGDRPRSSSPPRSDSRRAFRGSSSSPRGYAAPPPRVEEPPPPYGAPRLTRRSPAPRPSTPAAPPDSPPPETPAAPPPKRRGRPPKAAAEGAAAPAKAPAKRAGKKAAAKAKAKAAPKKAAAKKAAAKAEEEAEEAPPKRGRGRPRKNPLPEDAEGSGA